MLSRGRQMGPPRGPPRGKGQGLRGLVGVTPPLRRHQEQRNYRRAGHLSTSHGQMVTQLQRRV